MLYQRPTFSCPAAPHRTTNKDWDRAFLSPAEFAALYGADELDAALPQADGTP